VTTTSRSSSRESRGIQPIIRLGLDASPLRIGWCILVDDIIDSYGTTHIPRKAAVMERREFWRIIRDRLRQLERQHHTDVRTIGIEAPYVGPNRMGSLNHARNIGQQEALAHTSFPYATQRLIMPAEWRRALGLSTRGKIEPYAHANKMIDYSHSARSYQADYPDLDQDAADAICIAYSLITLGDE
jgi:hypothetical protein